MGVKKKLIRAFREIAEVRPTGKGRSNKELKRVQDFLCRFGYLKKRGFKAGTLDKKTSEALSHYQRAHGRRVTGDFNKATRDQMTTSRCGFPDMNKGIEFSTTCAWDKTDLTFTFDVGTNDVAGQQEFDAVRSAFQSWAAVTPLTFREVGLGDAPDISIGWRPANDPDLDMRGGTLAHHRQRHRGLAADQIGALVGADACQHVAHRPPLPPVLEIRTMASSAALAAPESIASAAISAPAFKSSARPATISAAAALYTTMSR